MLCIYTHCTRLPFRLAKFDFKKVLSTAEISFIFSEGVALNYMQLPEKTAPENTATEKLGLTISLAI